MKHLIISDYGSFLGTESNRLVIRQQDQRQYFPLNRLNTISIAKKGISLSSDLVEKLSARGIKLFFLDFKGTAHTMLVGANQHAVAQARINQYQHIDQHALTLATKIVYGKIKNQRATLSYFNKHHQSEFLYSAIDLLKNVAHNAKKAPDLDQLLGYEGYAARIYFEALTKAKLFTSSFKNRQGRGAQEISNSMLNLGYAILSSYILSAITNAGLEPYIGFLHQKRPGRMSLVLDLMEEYRAWVVDRAVIKMRSKAEGKHLLDAKLKKAVIQEIQKTLTKTHHYNGKRLKLEHIIQRQIYRLSGEFAGEKTYKPYLFKW